MYVCMSIGKAPNHLKSYSISIDYNQTPLKQLIKLLITGNGNQNGNGIIL